MKRLEVKEICINGLVATLYIILTIFIPQLSFSIGGVFQIRIAEILMVLAFISPKYFAGLIVGCFISNLFSGFIVDIIVGTLQTTLSCFILFFLKNKKHISILLSSLLCGIIIGLELVYLGFSTIGYFIILSIFISEFITLEIGNALFIIINKKISFI